MNHSKKHQRKYDGERNSKSPEQNRHAIISPLLRSDNAAAAPIVPKVICAEFARSRFCDDLGLTATHKSADHPQNISRILERFLVSVTGADDSRVQTF